MENIVSATVLSRRDRTISAVTATLLRLREPDMSNFLLSFKTALECLKLLQENAIIFLLRLMPLLLTVQHLFPSGVPH